MLSLGWKQKQKEKDIWQNNVFDPQSSSLSDQSQMNFLRDFKTRAMVNPVPLQVRLDDYFVEVKQRHFGSMSLNEKN